MIFVIFRFAKKFMLQYFSYLIYKRRKYPALKNRLSTRTLFNLLSYSAKLRNNYSNLISNNCVLLGCENEECLKNRLRIVNSEVLSMDKVQPEASLKPDVSSLIMLLQAIGFQLREFEKKEAAVGETAPPKESIKVTINCGSSEMRAVLEMDGVKCQCPSEKTNQSNEGTLWSISGHAPANNESGSNSKYEETGSNLLPTIPKELNEAVKDVIYRLFKLMNDPSLIDNETSYYDLSFSAIGALKDMPKLRKTNSQDKFIRSRTQPIIPSYRVRPHNNENLPKKQFHSPNKATDLKYPTAGRNENRMHPGNLQRQKTWDLEPEIDTGTNSLISCSPASMDRLYSSLSMLSIGSEDDSVGLIDYVVKAYRCLDKAVNLLARKAPLTSSSLSLNVSEQSFDTAAPTTETAPPSPKVTARPASSCSIPSRLPPKTTPLKPLHRRSLATPVSRPSTENLPGGGIASGRRSMSTISATQKSTFTISAREKSSPTILPSRKSLPSISEPRKIIPTTSGPQKLNPPRLAATTRPRTSSVSSMTSSTSTTLRDKFLLTKNRTSADLKANPLAAKTTSVGANTSLKTPVNGSKITSQTSTGISSKYGLSRNKKV